MLTRAVRAALIAVALVLAAAPAADAARLSSSAATTAATRAAERYADATNAEDHGVDSCTRRSRTAFSCDLFVAIAVDDATQRECTATVTVRLGKRRAAKPVATRPAWRCEDQSVSAEEDDEGFDDVPDDDDPGIDSSDEGSSE